MSQTDLINPAIPRDSLILVTGVNGLIASHVADQFLTFGYRVRGTVRNKSKNQWISALFDGRYGPGRFELAEIPDVSAQGAWDTNMTGVSGVAHVLGLLNLKIEDCDRAAEEEMLTIIAILEAARKETVKAFVFTSSAWAAGNPDASKKSTLTEWTWNDEAVELCRTKLKEATEENRFYPYMAVRTLLEQKLWEWVRTENPPFTFNTILPSTVLGASLHPKDQPMPSTAGMVKWAYEGTKLEQLDAMEPQWGVDARDIAMLYVAIITTENVNGERIFAYGQRYSWPKIVEILRGLFPGKEFPDLLDRGWDQTEVPNRRSEELLRRVKQSGWASLEQSIKEASECF